MKTFSAPWGRETALVFLAFFVICGGVPLIGLNFSPEHPALRWIMIIFPLALLSGVVPFIVRSYTLESGTLIVHRLGWSQRFDLSSLISADIDPSAMEGSIKLLFWFHNQKLGAYQAIGTDAKHSVVLRFTERIMVVTPDRPENFVSEIAKRK